MEDFPIEIHIVPFEDNAKTIAREQSKSDNVVGDHKEIEQNVTDSTLSNRTTQEIDDLVNHLAVKYGYSWLHIARRVRCLKKVNYEPKFLQNRYQLLRKKMIKRNEVKRVMYSKSEDEKLLRLIGKKRRNFKKIAKLFPGRDSKSLKNRYNRLTKNQRSQKKDDEEKESQRNHEKPKDNCLGSKKFNIKPIELKNWIIDYSLDDEYTLKAEYESPRIDSP